MRRAAGDALTKRKLHTYPWEINTVFFLHSMVAYHERSFDVVFGPPTSEPKKNIVNTTIRELDGRSQKTPTTMIRGKIVIP
jgi:hypothetical protein